MELFSLLEKNEQRQIRLFQLLLEEKGSISINQAFDRLTVDRATLKEDVQMLKEHLETFDGRLTLEYQDGELNLFRSGNLSANEFYYAYLQESIKYQILLHLLEHGTYERQKLLTQLNISTATLTRRIKELNAILQEFHLQIKNGRLQGSESQIRYFYFQLLWFGRPYRVNQLEAVDQATEVLLALLEETFPFTFTEDGEIMFKLWLKITKSRLRCVKKAVPDYQNLPLHLFEEAPFLISLQTFLSRFFFQYAFSWNQNETLIFYLFMICNFTLDTSDKRVQGFLLEEKYKDDLVGELNRTFKKNVQDAFSFYEFTEEFSQKVALTVMQNHYRLVYFRGLVSVFGQSGLKQRILENQEQQLLALCKKMTQHSFDILGLSDDDRLHAGLELYGRYISILVMVFKKVELRLTIACDFPYERLMSDIMMEIIHERLDRSIKFDLVSYQKGQSYDVILTGQNKEYPSQQSAQVFVLTSSEYDFDFPYLNQFLRQCYLQKIKLRMDKL